MEERGRREYGGGCGDAYTKLRWHGETGAGILLRQKFATSCKMAVCSLSAYVKSGRGDLFVMIFIPSRPRYSYILYLPTFISYLEIPVLLPMFLFSEKRKSVAGGRANMFLWEAGLTFTRTTRNWVVP